MSYTQNDGDLHKHIQGFCELHRRRWNLTSTPSIFNDPNYCGFLEYAMKSLAAKGQADVFYLMIEDRPVAFLIVFIYDHTYCQFMTANDTSLSQFAPGIVLLTESLEDNLHKDYKEYDFMRGAEKYKLRYANRIKKLYKLSLHKNILLFALDNLSSRLELYIKQHENLYNFFIKFEKKLRIF